jgi:sec-independent protein translocase protein TatA
MGLGELSPWHLLILAAVILVLFGAKRLPDSARSLGKAMRIFKTETSGLRGDHGNSDSVDAAPPQQIPAPPPAANRPTQESAAPAAVPDAQRTNTPG